MIYLVLLI